MRNNFVYVIRLKSEFESFYKIGMTNRLSSRLYYFRKHGYKCDILFTSNKMDLMSAYHYENKLQKLHNKFIYIPNIKFGGYTECFSKILIDKIK